MSNGFNWTYIVKTGTLKIGRYRLKDICLGLWKPCQFQHSQPATFPRKYTGSFRGSVSPHSLLTHFASVWPSPQVCRGWAWLAKAALQRKAKDRQKCLSLWDPPTSLGSDPGGLRLVSAGSQGPGLSTPTLLDGSFPEFSSGYRSCRQAKFCPKFDSVFIISDLSLHLTISSIWTKPCSDICSWTLSFPRSEQFSENVFIVLQTFLATRGIWKLGKSLSYSPV